MATTLRRMRAAPTAPAAPSRRAIREEPAPGYVSTTMSRAKKVIDETERQVHAEPKQFDAADEVAHVRVSGGLTINMGDFNSLRIDCAVTLPCLGDDESLNEAYEKASAFVAERVAEEETRWLGDSKKGGR